jgi:DNA-binding MarR family transcriptional regulator
MSDARQLGDPGQPSFQVEKYPFYLLNRLVSRYNQVIGSGLKTIGIDIPTWRVLMILGERAPRGTAEIADAAVINISTMTRIIQRMSRAGLVECGTLEQDGRVTEVSLTRVGELKLCEARAVTAPVYARIIAGFSSREFDRLVDSLNRMYANLS